MNNKLYFKYFLLLLITLNTINVYSFNPRSNQIINFLVIRNVKMCPVRLSNSSTSPIKTDTTNSYLNSFNKNNTINIKLNTLFFNKLLFNINNYTYS
jgi:hypothetical protein